MIEQAPNDVFVSFTPFVLQTRVGRWTRADAPFVFLLDFIRAGPKVIKPMDERQLFKRRGLRTLRFGDDSVVKTGSQLTGEEFAFLFGGVAREETEEQRIGQRRRRVGCDRKIRESAVDGGTRQR